MLPFNTTKPTCILLKIGLSSLDLTLSFFFFIIIYFFGLTLFLYPSRIYLTGCPGRSSKQNSEIN